MTTNIQKVKDDLIAELDKRITDKIIEKTNADLLKKLIEQAETINEAIMIAELGTTYRRTGFNFDKRLEKMTDTIKYFKKNGKLSFVQNKSALTHKLIVGDNYDALLNLLIEYRGKIDVIYIDPPYGKDSMGEFAQTNYNNAITRDNLLSMLYPRLVLTRQLLSDNGVIFCSIDDKNHAYVEGLLDEVFGESNFVENLIWKSKSGGASDSKFFATDHEYILCYAKNTNLFKIGTDKNATVTTVYNLEDENGKYGLDRLDKQSLGYIESLDFPIIDKNGKVYTVEHKDENNKAARWRWAKDTVIERFDELVFKDGKVYTKNYEKDGVVPRSLLIDERFGRTRTGKTTLTDILGIKDIFGNPKPTNIIKYLLEISAPSNSIVLDFFAGSGTAGQAVLELNKQDGGKRQFILATANEITDTTPNGIVYDVTSKRLKRVMTGECYDSNKDFKWNEKNKPLGDNLDVYEIATIAPYSDEPFTQIDETLYGQEKLGVNEKIKWVCENFEGTQKTLEDK